MALSDCGFLNCVHLNNVTDIGCNLAVTCISATIDHDFHVLDYLTSRAATATILTLT